MTGRLKVKNGLFYAIINYKDNLGRYKQKWIPTGLSERGNKKEAQSFLQEQLETFKPNENIQVAEKPKTSNDIIFIDYVKDYLEHKKAEVSPSVYYSYITCYKVMKLYFGKKQKLKDITYQHILNFYDYLKKERGNKNMTLKHHATILSPALRQAYRDDLIAKNPYEFLPKIKKEKTKMSYYNKNELDELFKVTDKTAIGLIVRVAAYYGFRRSELIGIKWSAIDFDNKVISISHKVLTVEGIVYLSDTLKTTSSHRKLPLLPEIEKLLLDRKEEIEDNKLMYGRSYNKKYLDYVFVDDIGDIIKPDYVSNKFRELLKANNLKHIRFHDLRHSCASLLVASGVPMKNIQEWLGHSNFSTTADIYSHLDFSAKIESANIISSMLSKKDNKQVIDDEIKELERLLEEKRKKRRQDESEM